MDQLIETELVKTLTYSEDQNQFPNFLKLKRLSYKKSYFVIEKLFSWYSIRTNQNKDKQVALRGSIRVLEYSSETNDFPNLWTLVNEIVNNKNVESDWKFIETDLVEFVAQLYNINPELLFSSYFSILEKSFIKPSKLKLWVLLGKSFIKNDIPSVQRFLSRYCARIENIHGSELKIAICGVFVQFGNQLSFYLGKNSPPADFSHFIENKVIPKIIKYSQKAKYHHITFLALASVLGLCSKKSFHQQLVPLYTTFQNLIHSRTIDSQDALLSMLQLTWIYLNRHTESWATMGRNMEELCKNIFLSDIRKFDEDLLVEIITVIFLKMPRIALNAIILPKLAEQKNDWEKYSTLISAVRNCLAVYCGIPQKPNIYPTHKGYFFVESFEHLKDNFHVDLLGPFDSKEFFNTLQKQLGKILMALMDVIWYNAITDPKENTSFIIEKNPLHLITLILFFIPIPESENTSISLCDCFVKLLFIEELEFEMERFFNNLSKYPILWMETLSQILLQSLKLSEVLIEKKRRLFKFTLILLGNKNMILEERNLSNNDIKLPIELLRNNSSLYSVSKQFIELYPTDVDYLQSKDFEDILYKRTSRLFYFCISRSVPKEVLETLKNYFSFIINKNGENPKMKRLKKSSWSFESLSKLSLDPSDYNLSEIYSMISQSLEHENSDVRRMAFEVLKGIPLGQIPILLDSLFDLFEKCSEDLRNVKYKPLKSLQKMDELKVYLTNLFSIFIERICSFENNNSNMKLEEKFIKTVQRHLLEVFYFESEIDVEIALPELRLSFYSLIRGLFNLDRTCSRKYSIFPYKLQTELFSHLKKWYYEKMTTNHKESKISQKLEAELADTMFTLCDGLLTPPPSLRSDCIPVNIVFSWIDDIALEKKYPSKVQKALIDLLQNGAIVDQIIDRAYRYNKENKIYLKTLAEYSNQFKQQNIKIDICLKSCEK